MPRASTSGKRQSGATVQRDNKHDNGLVGPSKRNSGRKSQTSFDGTTRLGDNGISTQAQLASSAINSIPNTTDINPVALHNDHFPRRDSLADSESSSASSTVNMAGPPMSGGHRQIDVNAMKNADVHKDSGPFELATTVLRSLPVQDTLAILIILMHVPSLSLTMIYAMFTCLTFVPPVTTSSGMNINFAEIFDGNSTTPSLVTVLCMDFFFMLIWLFLWPPVQDAILDFAKPIIAITLGGGTTSRDGTSNGFSLCLSWVLLQHLLRGTRGHWTRLAHHVPEHWRVPYFFGESLSPTAVVHDKRSAYAWLRSGLAIHILTQGIVRHVREWYLKREKGTPAPSQIDPEAGKSSAASAESATETGTASADGDHGLMQASHSSTTKKKRKQSTQVRLQQPLWAALASTKIVVMKEYEVSHASLESAGSNATDIHNLGNAPFDRQPRQIWISYIGSDEACFSTSSFPDIDPDEEVPYESDEQVSRPSGMDTTKPFYVKVNNAFWQPTRLFAVKDSEPDHHDEGTRWTGDIYGLRPASKYVCDFVDTRTHKIIFTTSIRTVQEPQREADGGAATLPNGQRSHRPDSPATTLKTSIAAAEARLAEEKTRLKSSRKDWKARTNGLKKENELLDNQLASAGSNDEKYKQKIRQQETQKSQADRDTENLAEKVKGFDTAPELVDRKRATEMGFAAEKKLFDAAQKDFKEFKNRLEKEVKAREFDNSNLSTRRNKIATRIAKVESELHNITDANNRGLNEAERRNKERIQWQSYVSEIEQNYVERLNHVRASNAGRTEQIRALQAQLRTLDYMGSSNNMPVDMNAAQDPSQAGAMQSSWNPNPAAPPHVPGGMGMWSGSSTDLMTSPPVQSSSTNAPSWFLPPTAPPFAPRSHKTRGRSSSMLSDISGFTQSSAENEASPAGPNVLQQRPLWAAMRSGTSSRGSHSTGGSSGTGSVGDPMSPR